MYAFYFFLFYLFINSSIILEDFDNMALYLIWETFQNGLHTP